MADGGKAAAPDIPSWLLPEVGRLCKAQEVVLSCGTAVLARWEAEPGPRVLVAAEEFGIGPNAYELRLFGRQARQLATAEREALRGLLDVLRGRLEAAVPPARRETLRRVEKHVSLVADYVSEAYLLLRSDWSIVHVNTQFERLAGRPRARLVGRVLWEAFPGLRGSPFEREARAAMGGSVPRVFEEYNERLGRWFESRAYPCDMGLAVLSIDITERKSDERARADIEQKVLQVQRMEALGTLASGIAHDFNNILGAILGHVGLLREQIPAHSPARESVEQIGVAGARARDLVHRILAFSRENARELVRQPIRPLVEESLALLRSTLPAAVRLEHRLGDEPLCTTLNPSEVHQLVMNLCTNAWHALDAGRGRIELALREARLDAAAPVQVGVLRAGRYAVLEVRDNGSGMSGETLARLFEPFFTTKPRGKGTGLGLHIVQSIVTTHGGGVAVESALGAGTAFAVYLPATEATDAGPVAEAVDRAAPGHGERVAYVDDDEVVLRMVESLLDRAGFEVTVFSRPEALLEAVRSGTGLFDLLVTDYSMPGMTGLELARETRLHCPELPVVVSSGFVSEELRHAAQAAGVSYVLHKEKTYEDLPGLAAKALADGAAPGS